MLTGNKGEWSEIYTLFKLLGDKQLFSGNEDLEKIEDTFYTIIKIIRNESGKQFEYEINGDLVIISGGIEKLRVPVKTFTIEAAKLLTRIKGENGTFAIPEVESFMNSIKCQTLKAKSTNKTDIKIVIYDQKINQNSELGFSIKSELGNDATILNAGKTTNFIYEIFNFKPTSEEIESINAIKTTSKIKDRIAFIQSHGGLFKFVSLENTIFKNNLVLIDSALPEILAAIIKTFFTSKLSSIQDLCEIINDENPLEYDVQFSHKFYEYKIKRFLTDVALGMRPSEVWTGLFDASGGFLIVKENGDVLCYHIYNKNQFENYLFANSKLETASSKRHGFGNLYFEDNRLYFKLNLQIRFK
jgi:hypothetical protein